jgi:hypothetical protein
MKTKAASSQGNKKVEVANEEEGCELNLSADNQWLRLVVAGKQVASFHVDYVRKVLGTAEKTKPSTPTISKSKISATI